MHIRWILGSGADSNVGYAVGPDKGSEVAKGARAARALPSTVNLTAHIERRERLQQGLCDGYGRMSELIYE
jgi:hypothetical protein